jgi:DnaJ-class molecular chaperone
MAAADETPATDAPSCAPCRGTGHVISNLGGEPSTVTCPWCEGGGVQLPGHDAQAARRASAAPA